MKRDDDDDLFGAVPMPDDPDAEPTAAEIAHAKSFGQLVDKSILGHTPAAMSSDDRALLDVATVIRAVSGGVSLAGDKQRSIVEDALAKAIASEPGAPIPIGRARKPRRVLPWAIAGASSLVAAAAIVLLVVGRQPTSSEGPTAWQSRPADALIGPIARERAGDAEARIDTIFADRLDGFRDRTLGGRP